MAVLIVADHDGERLDAGIAQVITCARQLADEVVVLVAAEQAEELGKQAGVYSGVSRVIAADSPSYKGSAAENVAFLVAALLKDASSPYSHVLMAATSYGKNLAPRLAALLDVQPIADVIQVLDPETFKRPTYAGNILTTVRSRDTVKILTVRTTAFAADAASGAIAASERMEATEDLGLATVVSVDIAHSERPELSHARVIVSGGRGLGSAENFEILTPLADKLGAAIGASRAAVDLGFVPNDFQVGQTGKVVAPDVYIAVGISGAIQHMAGMRDSKYIIAINKDVDAPICSVADYWLADDLFAAVPALIDALATE